MGIRYIVVAGAIAPRGGPVRPVPRDFATALGEQLDLVSRTVDPRLVVFENEAWAPVRAQLTGVEAPDVDREEYFPTAAATDLSGSATPVLPDRATPDRWTGEVAPGDLYFAAASSDRWQLRVDGERVDRRRAFGWANAFIVGEGGEATLEYRTSPARWGLLGLQVALWALVIAVLLSYRRAERPRRPAATETVAADEVVG